MLPRSISNSGPGPPHLPPGPEALCLRRSPSSIPSSVGIASSDVPESTIARQPSPGSQYASSTPPALMAKTSSCQYPSWLSRTLHQAMFSPGLILSGSQPPKVISLSSFSEMARKTANVRSMPGLPQAPFLAAASMKLNSGVWDRLLSPRPITPSKVKLPKGSSLMSVADTNLMLRQPSLTSAPAWLSTSAPPAGALASLASFASFRGSLCRVCTLVCRRELVATAAGVPRHMSSCMKMPVTSPVPNETVIWSRDCAGFTSEPSTSMSTAVTELRRLYRRWFLHVSERQRVDGSMRWPLPVSKTTSKYCGTGPPSLMRPW
mmetsp:Transcript_97558/g.276484  ORF Transcript_97558/g.276484 Transcript_97558/m.276484 type:complete len:320 (+) Transcript_97558:282-1241(+)